MITKLNIYIFCILIHIYWFYLLLYNRLEERQQSKTSWKQINPSIQDYILSIKYQYILGMAIDCRIANRLNDISWWLLKKKTKNKQSWNSFSDHVAICSQFDFSKKSVHHMLYKPPFEMIILLNVEHVLDNYFFYVINWCRVLI